MASSNFYGSFFFLLPPSLGSPGSGWRPAGEPPEEGLSKWPRNVCLCGRCLSPTPAVLSASFTLPPTEEQSEGSNRASPQRAWHGRGAAVSPHDSVGAPPGLFQRESREHPCGGVLYPPRRGLHRLCTDTVWSCWLFGVRGHVQITQVVGGAGGSDPLLTPRSESGSVGHTFLWSQMG